MAEIKNTDNNKYWQEYGKIGTLIYCWYKYKMVQCFWKTVWHFLEMVKSGATYDLAIMLLIIYAQKKWKHMSTQELVRKYSEQHHSDSQKVEKTQVFISRWKSKQNVLYPYNRVLFSHEKKWITYICYRKDDLWKHYTKCKKPDTKAHEWYGSTYLKYPEQANLMRQKIRWVVVMDEGNVGWLAMCTGYGFSSGHVWMWELDCEESWAPKNWCFWTVVLEKSLQSPLDCKEIQPVRSKGDQSWVFIGRTDAKTETPVLWPPHEKSGFIGKTLMLGGIGGRRRRGRQRMRWLNGITNSTEVESKWTPGVGDGQGGLACCDSWGRKESDMTEWLNWTELKDV